MKKVILLLLLFPISNFLAAQKVHVMELVSPPVKVDDHPPVNFTDFNGKPCVEIEIISDIRDLHFTPEAIIINQQVTDTGYILYISSVDRKLTIDKEGYLPFEIDFDEQGMSTQAGEKWKMAVKKNEEAVLTIVESMPGFPGGEKARFEYMAQNLRYPAKARDKRVQGIVYVSFVVEPDGSITNPQILQGIGHGCDEEVIKLIKNMPKWNPGMQRGKPVRVQFNMPVKFTLQY